MIGVALLGCGTVGSGVIKLLQKNSEIIDKRIGESIVIKKVLERDTEKCRLLGIKDEAITQDIQEILDDQEIAIVVELIGGIEPAFSYIMAALARGKHVVTANKDLIAIKGKDLFDQAKEKRVDFYFEASVAGGIPIVYPMKQSLAANQIQEVIGILNGTTNYILSKMSREGRDFNEVLAEAQQLGYAESDPSADVDGLDAARKIAILSSIAFNSRVTLDDVYVEGIRSITADDIQYAKELGYVIKLLAIAKENPQQKIEVRVHPAFLPKTHPMAGVNDVFNAVFLRGDAVGEIMHYGRGAGQMPTASAVFGDIIEIARNILYHSNARIGCSCYDNKAIMDIKELEGEYYIRMIVEDRPGVLAGIAAVFGNNNVSIATVLQKTSKQCWAELILITHRVREMHLRDSLTLLKGLSIVGEIKNVIRLEGTDREAD
ncbi:homoserine dehydrogenase [Syntrophomonas wolfei]|jgi:homoserine dehydrogenase|uniref:Homoserine dehydrogenase n=1 Tax=Syntrophomonas wolfei TaxID=863 RepID=A0A354YY57_9FIRM|nr:homoserine dehydrogenase [Syntrophomonas wolfei]HBK54144.1 homoserine dehydrogenase [Syntrophomonas wolfei]